MTEPARVLFLHGGPGLNAELERQRFGGALPVHWWDQPCVDEKSSAPWAELVDAAVREVESMADRRGRSITLLASSFGAVLACAVVERVPQRISHVTVSGGILDIRAALTRLAARVAIANGDSELAVLGVHATNDTDPASLWTLVGRLFSTPNILDFYWSSAASVQRNAMHELAARGGLLHAPTFEAVLHDFLSRDHGAPPRPWAGQARILSGRHDPYASEDDAQHWRKVFPLAETAVVDTGHFPHLELPPDKWMPQP
jgi:pimeloyl-ACP methyl ester carboxylesterase